MSKNNKSKIFKNKNKKLTELDQLERYCSGKYNSPEKQSENLKMDSESFVNSIKNENLTEEYIKKIK